MSRLNWYTIADHWPAGPDWICLCDQPWPCASARSELLATHVGRPDLLGQRMYTLMEQAARDLHDPVLLWHRFLAWTPPTVTTVMIT